jgi:hypothetical protein
VAGRFTGGSLLYRGLSGNGSSVSGGRGGAPYDAVQIIGLAELQKSLKQIDPVLSKKLSSRFRVLAAEVRDAVRAKMPRGPAQRGHTPGRARSAVTSGASANVAFVKLGKGKSPYVAWLDFGGVLKPTGGRHGTQRRPLTPGRRGRYLYPTVDEHLAETRAAAERALEETKRELGL